MPLLINGKPIDPALLDAEFSSIKSYFESLGNVSCCERDPEFRGYARDNVIGRVLLAEEAERVTPEPPAAEVDVALAKLQEENGGELQFYARLGITPDQVDLVKRDLSANLRVKRLIDDLVLAEASPSEADLRKFYEENIASFMTPEQVRASHIMKGIPRGEMRLSVYDELREVRKKLLAGADFEELAKQHSEKANEHIDLGFFKRAELPEEFEYVAFSMNVDEISPVFGTPFGFHIITVTERKPSTPKPFEEVREQVLTALIEWRRQEKTRKLVEELKSRATIDDTDPIPDPPAHVHSS